MKKLTLRPIVTGIALALALPVQAATLEEVVVTAQKREESLQDVPIAVSAVSGEAMRANNISTMQQLSATVPNFYVAESFVGDAIYIRGVGSGQNNLGFEQAVGQVVDGFFYGRSRFSRISFLDLERVEVLKGPQGALLGKNTTAGAVNITTAKPTDEFEAWISPTYEFEADEGLKLEGAISGPLTDNLRARLALSYIDRDGYIKNTTTGDDDVGVEDLVGRLSLAWDASEDVEVLFQYQYGDIEHDAGNNQFSHCPTIPPFPIGVGPGEDCKVNYKRSGTATKFGVNVEGKETEFDTYSLTVNWQLGDHTLTWLTGYAEYEYSDLQDGDRTAWEATLPEFAEDYEQWTQEIRLVSPVGEDAEYIVGLFYQDKEQDTQYIVHFNIDTPPPPPSPGIGLDPVSRNTFTNETGEAYALFGQYTWHLNEQWDVTLGGRYTYEEKEGRSIQYPGNLYTFDPQAACLGLPGACDVHDVEDDFDEDNFSPVLNAQWRPNDDAMYYVSFRKGFKAGGYDHNLVADQATAPDRFRFDSEEVKSYEAGAKLTLLDGSMRLNGSVFRMEFDDLQLGGFLDSVSAINTVTNAGSAISEGVELDVTWAATDALTLFAAVAYLDSTYDDYEDAPCYTGQTAGCVNGRQDLSDQKLQFATDWKANVSAEYVWSLSDELNLTGFVQVSYSDDFPLQPDLDPDQTQDEYIKVDARLTLADVSGKWELSVIGKNLDNELTSHYGDDVPGQPGNLWRSVDAPRSVALQGMIRF
jgi:outer membrane receptor protein involved in Fe transport